MESRVKAAVINSPGELLIKEYPYPSINKDAALIKMDVSGVCGTDVHIYAGQRLPFNVPYPVIPGHENVGIVQEVGEGAAQELEFGGSYLKEGDRVTWVPSITCGKCYWCKNFHGYNWCDNLVMYGQTLSSNDPPHLFGGWAESIYILPRTQMFKVPEKIPSGIAVLTEIFAATYAIDRAMQPFPPAKEGFGAGDSVVVQGSGTYGMLSAIKAQMLGAGQVIMVGAPEFRLRIAREIGVDHTISIDELSDAKERVEVVRDLTENRGADLVVECAGVPSAVLEGLEMMRKGGTYVVVGNVADLGSITINPSKHLCAKNARIIAQMAFPYQYFGNALKLLQKNWARFKIDRLITHTYRIDEASKALEKAKQLECVKILVAP